MKVYTHPTIKLPAGDVVVKFYDDAGSGTENTPNIIVNIGDLVEGFDINIGEYNAPVIDIRMHNKGNYLLGTLLNNNNLRCAIFISNELFFLGHLTSSFSSEDDPSSGLVYTELDVSFEHHFAALRNVTALSFENSLYNNAVGILSWQDDNTNKRYLKFKAIFYEIADILGLKTAATGDAGVTYILQRQYFSGGDYPTNPEYLKDIVFLDKQLIGYSLCDETVTLEDDTPTNLDIIDGELFPEYGSALLVTALGVEEKINYTSRSGNTLIDVTCTSPTFNVTNTVKIYPGNGIPNLWSKRFGNVFQIFGEMLREFALIPRIVHDGTDFVLQIQERDTSRSIIPPIVLGQKITFRDTVTSLSVDLAGRPDEVVSNYLTLSAVLSNNYGDQVDIEMHHTNYDIWSGEWRTTMLWGKDKSGAGEYYVDIDAILNYNAVTTTETFQVSLYTLLLGFYYNKKNWRRIKVKGLRGLFDEANKLEYLSPGYNFTYNGVLYHIHQTNKSITKNETILTVIPMA